MKVSLVDPSSTDWSSALARCCHDTYHLPGWAGACAPEEAGEPVALIVDDGTDVALLPLVRRALPHGLWDGVTPYGYGGPISSDPGGAFVGRALVAARRALRDEGCVSLFLRLHPILQDWWQVSDERVVSGVTVAIDLTLPEDVLWGSIRSGHRQDIARARRFGVVSRWADDDHSHSAFAAMYRQTMTRLGAADQYFFGDEYFEALRYTTDGQVRLRLAELDGEVVGGALFTLSPSSQLVGYHLSATADQARRLQPTKVILDDVRRWGQQQGFTALHLGGGVGGRQDSLFQFKLGFSRTTYDYITVRSVVRPHDYERLVSERGDAGDSSYFPRYRAPRRTEGDV